MNKGKNSCDTMIGIEYVQVLLERNDVYIRYFTNTFLQVHVVELLLVHTGCTFRMFTRISLSYFVEGTSEFFTVLVQVGVNK